MEKREKSEGKRETDRRRRIRKNKRGDTVSQYPVGRPFFSYRGERRNEWHQGHSFNFDGTRNRPREVWEGKGYTHGRMDMQGKYVIPIQPHYVPVKMTGAVQPEYSEDSLPPKGGRPVTTRKRRKFRGKSLKNWWKEVAPKSQYYDNTRKMERKYNER